jgi:hypothetical protein
MREANRLARHRRGVGHMGAAGVSCLMLLLCGCVPANNDQPYVDNQSQSKSRAGLFRICRPDTDGPETLLTLSYHPAGGQSPQAQPRRSIRCGRRCGAPTQLWPPTSVETRPAARSGRWSRAAAGDARGSDRCDVDRAGSGSGNPGPDGRGCHPRCIAGTLARTQRYSRGWGVFCPGGEMNVRLLEGPPAQQRWSSTHPSSAVLRAGAKR